MRTLLRHLIAFWREDPGQDLIEYTLLLAFLAIAAAGVLSQVGATAQGTWDSANTTLAAANGTKGPAVHHHGDGGDRGGSGSDGGGSDGGH